MTALPKTVDVVLVIISAECEWRVVENFYPGWKLDESPFGRWFWMEVNTHQVIFFHGGWGKIGAAASAQYAIDRWNPTALINLGTCGGFEGRIEHGQVVLAKETFIYDIHEQMGDSDEALDHYHTIIDLSWLKTPYPQSVLVQDLISADRDIIAADIPSLISFYDAVAADWESGAIAWVAKKNSLRCLILRAVTDLVGIKGGEAYGNIEFFQDNTQIMMARLLESLPEWLKTLTNS